MELVESLPPSKRTYEACYGCVKQMGSQLQFVPKEHRDEAMCLTAMDNDARAFKYFPDNLKTDEIIDQYINKISLKYIPFSKRTMGRCLKRLSIKHQELQHVPTKHRDLKHFYRPEVASVLGERFFTAITSMGNRIHIHEAQPGAAVLYRHGSGDGILYNGPGYNCVLKVNMKDQSFISAEIISPGECLLSELISDNPFEPFPELEDLHDTKKLFWSEYFAFPKTKEAYDSIFPEHVYQAWVEDIEEAMKRIKDRRQAVLDAFNAVLRKHKEFLIEFEEKYYFELEKEKK